MDYSSVVIYALILLTTVLLLKRRQLSLPLPPGPRRLPIVGNLFNRPMHKTWLKYTEWTVQYGDVLSMEILGQPVIVVNSAKAANELFEKRSSIYADRPPFHMANDLRQWWWDFAHMRYSDQWRLHRKTFHQYFQTKEAVTYQPIQLAATHTFLKQMLETPDEFFGHVRHHAGSTVLRIIYGYEAHPYNDSYVTLADNALRGLVLALIPGSYVVDYFPLLKRVPSWLPFVKFQKEAAVAARDAIALRDDPFNELLKSIDAGTATPSFVSTNIEKIRQSTSGSQTNMVEVVRNCAGVAFAAGADTTVAVVLSAILALVHHPEVQAKAHGELDEVVGRNRIPDFDDQSQLPYIEAVLLEAMRWRPVTPLAIAHAAVSDDIYEGYFIPKGSTVFGNAWAILHDEATYPDAESFKPERFMGDKPQPNPINLGAFGFGRRICPGRYLALNTTFIGLAGLLWAFDIRPLGKGEGEEAEVLPDVMAYSDGVVSHPLPFKCSITPRFPEVPGIVHSL
ncbi:cytochrome P450 [Mucidula mucida]|nr:cytochrome P450 [Mucidula mucida]